MDVRAGANSLVVRERVGRWYVSMLEVDLLKDEVFTYPPRKSLE
jgi:hypothetical protein